MSAERAGGILLPISSLPSKYGIGTFGKAAFQFVDKLKLSGQKYWQVLPMGGTSFGDSPYQSFSTFAGNPYFIDLEKLIDEGCLKKSECEICKTDDSSSSYIDYEKLYNTRYKVLEIAFKRDKAKATEAYYKFVSENSDWLEDYCLFMALKQHFGGKSFIEWEHGIKHRVPEAIEKYQRLLADKIEFYKYVQFKFFEQWSILKAYANSNGIKVIGDIPIYVALDSADTWSNPKLFKLSKGLKPTEVAGCPPDAYAVTGQLWGNPIYNWRVHKKTGYAWWIKRIAAATKMYDTVRIDHFRGFAEYYSIPASDTTAERGVWVKGPGFDLFKSIKKALGNCDIIAEDLGFLTPSVYELLEKTGFPGMKVLQFGLYSGSTSEYLPYKYTRNTVCYTGTHDNQTTKSWLDGLSEGDMQFIKNYLCKKSNATTYDIIAMGLSSVSNLVIIPLQDYLVLDDSARMNVPSTIGDNWKWRLTKHQFSDKLVQRIAELARVFGR